MLNTARIDEINAEIRKIQIEQEETEELIKKLLQEEDKICEELRSSLSGIGSEFEDCNENQRLTALVEGRFNMLISAERASGELIEDLHETRKKVEITCKEDIEALERELLLLSEV